MIKIDGQQVAPEFRRSVRFRKNVVRNYSTQNDLNVTITGVTKRDWSITFQDLEKDEFETILAYCDVGFDYLVEIRTDSDGLLFEGYVYLSIDSDEVSYGKTKHTFTLNIEEI